MGQISIDDVLPPEYNEINKSRLCGEPNSNGEYPGAGAACEVLTIIGRKFDQALTESILGRRPPPTAAEVLVWAESTYRERFKSSALSTTSAGTPFTPNPTTAPNVIPIASLRARRAARVAKPAPSES